MQSDTKGTYKNLQAPTRSILAMMRALEKGWLYSQYGTYNKDLSSALREKISTVEGPFTSTLQYDEDQGYYAEREEEIPVPISRLTAVQPTSIKLGSTIKGGFNVLGLYIITASE